MKHLTKIDDWVEWKEKCALNLCRPTTQKNLADFARNRFLGYLHKNRTDSRYKTAFFQVIADPYLCWHRFETHMWLEKPKKDESKGKNYKDWLFLRTIYSRDNPLNIIEGGASLIMRTVMHDFRNEQKKRPDDIYLDDLLTADGKLTFYDILPTALNPAMAVLEEEDRCVARELAREVFAELSRPGRIVLLAVALELSLADKIVEQAAGCKKTRLYKLHHATLKQITRTIRKKYESEDPTAIKCLAIYALEELGLCARQWAENDSGCDRLCRDIPDRR